MCSGHVPLVQHPLGFCGEALALAGDLVQLILETHEDTKQLVGIDEVQACWSFLLRCVFWCFSQGKIAGLDGSRLVLNSLGLTNSHANQVFDGEEGFEVRSSDRLTIVVGPDPLEEGDGDWLAFDLAPVQEIYKTAEF